MQAPSTRTLITALADDFGAVLRRAIVLRQSSIPVRAWYHLFAAGQDALSHGTSGGKFLRGTH